MIEREEQASAEQKATQAAEVLAATGAVVTARSVRERSGVRMSVAAEAARAWNQREADAEAVPAIPDAIEARFAAVWREAVTAARAEFAEARTGWQTTIQQVEVERDAMAEEVEKLEAEKDKTERELADAIDRAAVDAERAASALAEQRSRADKVEARAEAIGSERDRLIAERDRLQAERDNLRDKDREQKE